MGKNAKRRKEAKLQEKLKRSASSAGGCHHDGPCHHHHEHAAPSDVAVTISQKALETTDR